MVPSPLECGCARPLLKRLSHPDGNRPPVPPECVVDAIVDVVLLVEREPQARAPARQKAVRAEVAPVSSDPADAAERHKPQTLPPVDPVLGLRGEHPPVLEPARRVPAQVAVEAVEAEVVEGDTAVGRAGHRTVGQDLTARDLAVAVIPGLIDLILAAAPPRLIEEVRREVDERSPRRVEGAVSAVALEVEAERRRVRLDVDLGNLEAARPPFAVEARGQVAELVARADEDVSSDVAHHFAEKYLAAHAEGY